MSQRLVLVVFCHRGDARSVLIGDTFDEEGVVPRIFADFADDPRPLSTVISQKEWDDQLRQEDYLERLDDLVEVPREQATCDVCQMLVDMVNDAIADGDTWADWEDFYIDVCRELLNQQDPRSTMICPGIVRLQGPHLWGVFAERNVSTNFACLTLNSCAPEHIEPPPVGREKAAAHRLPENKYVPDETPHDLSNAIRVLQFTDVHVDHEYAEGAPTDCGLPTCCRSYWPGTGTAGRWGDYECNTPTRTVEAILQHARTQNPNYVLYTGDNPPHTPWNETLDSQLTESRYVADMLKQHFAGIPIHSVIGNHENFPTNIFKVTMANTQTILNEFITWYRTASNLSPENENSIRAHASYSTLLRPGLRLLNYNTNYAYTNNWRLLHAIQDPEYANLKNFMTQELTNARAAGEKVIMAAHHPIGESGTIIDFGVFLTDLCVQFSDIIVLHMFGHKHDDQFKVFFDQSDGQAKGTQFVLTPGTPRGFKNPTYRIYYLDPNNFSLLDWDNYFLDLENPGDPVNLQHMYRCKEEYGMADMSPGAFADLLNRMENNNTLFDRFMWNRSGRSGYERDCDDACKHRGFCEARNTRWDLTRQCILNAPVPLE